MRRPLAIIGLTGLLLQWASVMTQNRYSLPVSVCCALAAALYLLIPRLRKQKMALCIWLTAAVILFRCGYYQRTVADPLTKWDGRTVNATLQVLGEPEERNDSVVIAARVQSMTDILSGESCEKAFGLELTVISDTEMHMGDVLQANMMKIRAPGNRAATLAADGIALCGLLSGYGDCTVTPGKMPIWKTLPLRARDALCRALFRILPEQEAALCATLTLGERAYLPEAVTDAFRACGMSHVLVVSGLHMTVLSGVFYAIWRFLCRSRRMAALLCMPTVVFYMAMLSFSPSVTRAGCMNLLMLLGILCCQNSDPLNALGFSALAVCLWNPQAAGDVGLQLSFTATFAVIFSGEYLLPNTTGKLPEKNVLQRLFKNACAVFLTSVAVEVMLLPIVALSFGTVALLAPLSNVFLVPIVTAILPFAMATAVLGVCPFVQFSAQFAGLFAGFLAKIAVAAVLAVSDFSPKLTDENGVLSICAGVFLILSLIAVLFRKKGVRMALSAAICIGALTIGWTANAKPQAELQFLTVSEGYAVSVKTEREEILILNTDALLSEETLRKIGSPNLLILPRTADESRYENAQQLLKEKTVGRVMVNDAAPPLALRRQERIPFPQNGQWAMQDMTLEFCGDDAENWCRIVGKDWSVLLQLRGNTAQTLPETFCKNGIAVFSENGAKNARIYADSAVIRSVSGAKVSPDCAGEWFILQQNQNLCARKTAGGWHWRCT